MRLTKRQLKRIIKEERTKLLKENAEHAEDFEIVMEQERKLKRTMQEAGATDLAKLDEGKSKSLTVAGQKEEGEDLQNHSKK